jgi:hypothetical protein
MAARVEHHSKTPPESVITYWSTPTGIGRSGWTALRVRYPAFRCVFPVVDSLSSVLLVALFVYRLALGRHP